MLWSRVLVGHFLLAKVRRASEDLACPVSEKKQNLRRRCNFLSYHVRKTLRTGEETSLWQRNAFGWPTPDDFSAKETFSMHLLNAPELSAEGGFPVLGAGQSAHLPCCSQDGTKVTRGFIPVPRAPDCAESSPRARSGPVMGDTQQIPPQVNVSLVTQTVRRARSLRAHARVRVCSLSCAKPPQPHGVGSSSGGLHQTKPLCSTPFLQPSTAPPSRSRRVCQHTQASHTRGVLLGGEEVGTMTWVPPTPFFGAPALSASHFVRAPYHGRAELRQEG